ncbi:MAG: hypothetical protein AAFR46_03850 [Pseudomonadota bacterium]
MSLLPRLPRPRFDPLPSRTARALIEPRVDEALVPLGFERVAEMTWVESANAPIRKRFSMQNWKGAAIVPRWGVSLDYVPHVAGSQIDWHCTPKTACDDLFWDAMGLDLTGMHGRLYLEEAVPGVIARCLDEAKPFWEETARLDALPDAFRANEERRRAECRLGFANLSQPWLAWGFTHARLGDAAAGQPLLDLWIAREATTIASDLIAEIRRRFAQVAS